MQFGRFQGIALAVLGFLLILVQVILGFSPREPHDPNETSTGAVEHKTTIVPGVIGCGLLVVGLVFVFTASRRDEPASQNTVK